MKGKDIIETARKQLKDFIAFEVLNIYRWWNEKAPNFEDGEEYIADVEGVTIGVDVDNSYLDVEECIKEKRSVIEVHLTLDENVFVVAEGDDTEIEWKDLSTDELAEIANTLERDYLDLVNNK